MKLSEQNNNLFQKCTLIEGLFLVSVNTIHDMCFIRDMRNEKRRDPPKKRL